MSSVHASSMLSPVSLYDGCCHGSVVPVREYGEERPHHFPLVTGPASGLWASDLVFAPLLVPLGWEAERVGLLWRPPAAPALPLVVARRLQLLHTLLHSGSGPAGDEKGWVGHPCGHSAIK